MPQLIAEMETIVFSGTKLNIDYWINDIFDEDQIDELNKNLNILSTSFNPDNSINIRIYSESRTNKGFKKVDPNLEDVYFITLKENS
mgnify:CR=1 FL=1